VGNLGGSFGLSGRDVAELIAVGFDTPMSLGRVPAQKQSVSAALMEAVDEAKDCVREQSNLNSVLGAFESGFSSHA
jgi:hypothetical protein